MITLNSQPDHFKSLFQSSSACCQAAEETSDSAQSSAVPETEVVSAESDPVSEELIVPITPEEASSVTPAEISAAQTPPRSGIIDVDLCLLDSVSSISFITITQRFLLMPFCTSAPLQN